MYSILTTPYVPSNTKWVAEKCLCHVIVEDPLFLLALCLVTEYIKSEQPRFSQHRHKILFIQDIRFVLFLPPSAAYVRPLLFPPSEPISSHISNLVSGLPHMQSRTRLLHRNFHPSTISRNPSVYFS
jgi:hypothetical protein